MWFVYILRCADGSFYVGATNDIPSRLAKHNNGTAAAHTATRRSVHLVYIEGYSKRDDCLKRERQFKRWTRAKKEALIAGDTTALKRL